VKIPDISTEGRKRKLAEGRFDAWHGGKAKIYSLGQGNETII